jgi:hypothetical protein
VETVTQILHRLNSYEPGPDWDDVVSDPHLVLDLKPTTSTVSRGSTSSTPENCRGGEASTRA